MSRNPKKAIAALVPAPITTASGQVVQPLSLGVFALLERIDSPMLWSEDAPASDTLDILPTLYLLTHDPAESLAAIDDIDSVAMRWANTLAPAAIREIQQAARRQVSAMTDAIADEGDQKKKEGTTDGSQPSHNGQRRRTAGSCSTSYGKCLQAQSCSCADNGATPTSTPPAVCT